MLTNVPVLVLRLDHHGALGLFRSLGRLGIAVYGMDARDDAPALRSRYARGHFRWDLDAEPPARSVERLLAISDELGHRPILVPTNDETALFVAAHADRLRSAFRFQENPSELVRQLYDKRTMNALARQHGIPTAHILVPRSRDEVRAFAAGARFPVMLKGGDGIRLARRTGEKMRIVRSATELLDAYEDMEDFARPDLMLQEYIPGGEDAQWMFNGYFNDRSDCLFGVVGQKLRQAPPYTGMTSLGMCARNDEVDALTRRFMKEIGYCGVLDIGYRFDARDGRYKVLDVNPRLGATFRLFVGEFGLDVARALYFDLTGQPVPPSPTRPGRKWLVEELDLASSLRYQRDDVLTVRDWLRSFAGVRECAWFASDDPRPFLDLCGRVAARALRKVAKRAGLLPSTSVAAKAAHQTKVRQHFADSANDWKRAYELARLEPRMIQERHAMALRWIESVPLQPEAQVLEVGCGAGQTAVALARRGYRVHALDATTEMLELTAQSARAAGLPNLTTRLGDAHALDLGDGSFDLVVALGVLPWLHTEARALAEMARVLRRGGWLIATADNCAPLHRLLDPRATPTLAPIRAGLRRLIGRVGPRALAKSHDAGALDELVRGAGLQTVKRATVGFGPFSLFGHQLLSEPASLAVHRRLQALADRDWPVLRSTGVHHVILARKSP